MLVIFSVLRGLGRLVAKEVERMAVEIDLWRTSSSASHLEVPRRGDGKRPGERSGERPGERARQGRAEVLREQPNGRSGALPSRPLYRLRSATRDELKRWTSRVLKAEALTPVFVPLPHPDAATYSWMYCWNITFSRSRALPLDRMRSPSISTTGSRSRVVDVMKISSISSRSAGGQVAFPH